MTNDDRNKPSSLITNDLARMVRSSLVGREIHDVTPTATETEVVRGSGPSAAGATQESVGRPFLRFVRFVVIAIVVAVIAWLLTRTLVAEFFVASTIRDLSTVIDINPWIAKALEVLLFFLAFAFVGALFSLRGRTQRNAMAGSVLVFTVIYGSAWFLTRDVWFDKNGTPLKCYVITHQGVQLFDTKRFDPRTGQKCQAISQQLAPAIQRLVEHQNKNLAVAPVDPSSVVAFSQRTGEPLLWFVERENGEVLFFDVPGFDRDTGKPFRQVTPEYWRIVQRRLGTPRIGDTRVVTRSIVARSPDGGQSSDLPVGTNVAVDGIDGDFAYVRDGDRPWRVKIADLHNWSRRIPK